MIVNTKFQIGYSRFIARVQLLRFCGVAACRKHVGLPENKNRK
jgi:hypothetical protein